jgi:hypothetical protein
MTGRAPTVAVYVEAPPALAAKAAWVLGTLLAPAGGRTAVVRDRGAAAGCALAYAPEPVPGVPTLPFAPEAAAAIEAKRPVSGHAFAPMQVGGKAVAGAFPVGGDGFAAPFDLIASAFVLLACWDEFTSAERDQHGRLPFAASVYAHADALRLGEPAVDGYARIVRALVDGRRAEAGLPPLPGVDWGEGEAGRARFALALTHDVDGLKRWTRRGWLAAGKRTVGAVRTRDFKKARFELGGTAYGLVRDVPRGEDPYWTFPHLLSREDELGVASTFFLLAGHGHPIDGSQPGVYRRRLPDLLRLLGLHHREVGLHGNHADGRDAAALADHRSSLGELAGQTIDGIRYHYLKCAYHETLPLLDAAGFAYDTSIAFAEREGFRCGCSFPFHPYDVRRDRPLAVTELPLGLMDSTLQEKKYRALDAAAAAEAAPAALRPLAGSGGAAAILWHHNRFHPWVGQGYGDVYWQLVDWVREQGGVALPAGEVVRRWRAATGETTL